MSTDRFTPQPLPYIVAGAIPDPLLVPVQDADGAPRNLAGYSVQCTFWRTGASAPSSRAGTVVDSAATSDAMQVTWQAADFATPGTYRIVVWATSPGLTVRIPSPVYELQVVDSGMTPS